jgi:hypothetical protein
MTRRLGTAAIVALAGAALLASTGCGPGSGPDGGAGPSAAGAAPTPGDGSDSDGSGAAVDVRTIAASAHCGFEVPAVLSIADRDGLRRRLEAAGLTPSPLMPGRAAPAEVDFSREHVLIVALGSYPDAGHSVALADGVSPRRTPDGAIDIAVQVTHPPPDAMTAQMLTSPCVFLAVSADAGDRLTVTDTAGAVLGSAAW